jgi:hypothetical protein
MNFAPAITSGSSLAPLREVDAVGADVHVLLARHSPHLRC